MNQIAHRNAKTKCVTAMEVALVVKMIRFMVQHVTRIVRKAYRVVSDAMGLVRKHLHAHFVTITGMLMVQNARHAVSIARQVEF